MRWSNMLTLVGAHAEGEIGRHPARAKAGTISFVMLCARPEKPVAPYRNGTVMHPGRMDRSPCGTGTAARLAVMHARGEMAVGER